MKTSKKRVSLRTLGRFRRAAAQYGGKVLRADFEPLGVHMVFEGPTGGWTVKVSFPGRKVPYIAHCIGYNVNETIEDIRYHGEDSRKYLKRPDLTIPKDEVSWKALATCLYQDTVDLMTAQACATALKDGDNKGAWEIIKTLRGQDVARMEKGLKEAVV